MDCFVLCAVISRPLPSFVVLQFAALNCEVHNRIYRMVVMHSLRTTLYIHRLFESENLERRVETV